MSNFKRGKCRYQGKSTRTSKTWFLNSWPVYWDILHYRRPRRRREAELLRAILADRLDNEDVVWPLGNHKPHHYYW